MLQGLQTCASKVVLSIKEEFEQTHANDLLFHVMALSTKQEHLVLSDYPVDPGKSRQLKQTFLTFK